MPIRAFGNKGEKPASAMLRHRQKLSTNHVSISNLDHTALDKMSVSCLKYRESITVINMRYTRRLR